ncbi:MAG: precorrin-6y C5,15-methyltransferase (decarboxylating) subunit CbiE [Desulfovibrionaceae bacterium]|nr:precorrin-6y C5,15-methyltransferase (decarboxylating) subunit CbiE [Desulfovibrionaceae bacterium]
MPALPAPIHVFGLGLPVLEEGAALPRFRRLAHPAIEAAQVLIGGKAQLAPYADHPGEKLPVGKDLESLYAAILANSVEGKDQVVLCGGDPLFFGLGSRLAEHLGPESLRIYPGASCLQAAAALIGLPWEQVRAVSLHGRHDWFPLAHALLSTAPVLVLTDAASSPADIATWMLQRGLWRYELHVLDNMYQMPDGSIRAASHLHLGPEQAEITAWESSKEPIQRVVLIRSLIRPQAQPWPFGLDDADVVKENKLLTKAPVRAAALAALSIEPWHTVWDLGAGSGAVGLEAARLAWQGRVYAVERNPDRITLIRENRRKYGAANLEIVQGELPACLPPARAGTTEGAGKKPVLPCPERIFIGGGLGGDSVNATEILARAWNALAPGGRLVVDCVLLSSLELTRAVLFKFGAKISVSSLQASTSSPLAGDMRLEALNPVFLILAEKERSEGGAL